MNRFFIVCVVLLACHILNAQNSVKGFVKNQDNQPLEGALVFMPEINKSSITDKNGHYELQNLPNGKIRVQFTYLGHTSVVETIQLNGAEIKLDTKLNTTSIETEEIVVTNGYHATQHENAVKIDVLKLDIHKNRATPNFSEMLTKIPGVDMISKGSGVSKPVIRGLSMNDILILNNGVRFENYQYSSHHPLGIDEFGVSEVEIIKGPASLLYGSDAIGGVINFIKEKPALANSVEGDYNLQLFSNTLGVANNLGVKAASNKLFGGVRIGQKSNADFLQGGGEYAPNSRFNEYSLKTNMAYSDKIGIFKLYYDYNKQNLGLVEEEAIEEITTRDRSNEIFYQQLNTHLLSSQNRFYLGVMKLDVNSAYQNTELIHFGEANQYEIQMKLATLTYETKLYLPSNKNSEYIIGFQGSNQLNTNLNNRETILLPNATTNNYSGFVLLQNTLFQKLKLQAGARYDNKTITTETVGSLADLSSYRAALNKNYGSFSGSFGATYALSTELLLRGNIASAYRTPNIAELTSNGQHETRYEIGNEHLIPEKSFETDLSMHYHRNSFTIDLAGYYNVINDYIFISPTGESTTDGVDIYRYKQNNSALYGGEVGLHIHPASLKWLHFETTYASVIGKQKDGNYLPFIPAHKLNFELRGEKEDLLLFQNAFATINSTTAFDQNRAAPDETATSGYTLFDIAIGGNLAFGRQSIAISLSANNIFDKRYIDHLSTLKEVNLFNPGRNITLSLKVPFGVKVR